MITGDDRLRLARRRGERRKRPVAERRRLRTKERVLIGAIAVAVILGLWELAADTRFLNPLIASSPSRIVSAWSTLVRTGQLGSASLESAKLFGVGFALSALTGVLAGLMLGWYRFVHAVFDPFVSVLYAAPRIALIPLITVWTGLGFTAQVVVVWLTAVFPIMINMAAGVEALDRDLLKVARSLGATSRQVLWTIALPGSLPYLLAGLRQGIALALIGVVVAEYFIGSNGLGGLIIAAGNDLNSGEAFVGVVIFSAAAIILTACLRALEKRLALWLA